ncbi:MAG: hypothetical protein PHP44_10525 [Kiritimatiellae bacterium]|nr:hypothetical protein [Kiritimatiellia bacterium]MDD4736522.1 hypothetical protein [Kiritimatiellia bacterium]
MSAQYRIDLFGKTGCAKCKVLGQRLDKLLQKDEWKDVEKKYYDVETEEGIITFCEAECINPQRIPALMLKRRDEMTGEYVPVINLMPGREDEVCGSSKLYQYIGLQTDYTDEGKGVISPKMITTVLEEAALER